MKKINLPVVGMSCASCAVSVETMIRAQTGVHDANVNYANQSVFVEFDPAIVSTASMKKAVMEIGYDLVIEEENTDEIFDSIVGKRFRILKSKLIIAVLFSVPVFILSMFFHSYAMHYSWLILVMSLPVIFWSGSHFYINAFKQIRHLTTSMDTLIALGTGAAFLFSVFNTFFPGYLANRNIHPQIYYESAVIIITLVLLGKFLEERSKTRASYAIKKLVGLRPKVLTIVRDGQSIEIPTAQVTTGDIIVVKPGEKIAVDGEVIEGETFIDESSLTGEALPVLKKAGDKVFAGTMDQNGTVCMVAQKIGSQTVLSQIIDLIRESQASKPPVQRLADKISRVFVPVIILLAAITFASWYFLSFKEPFTMAFLTSITVLIIACPCALGLATPTALVVGIGKAAENGILIRNAEALEVAAKINTIVLDKTGTITTGKPEVEIFRWLKEDYMIPENTSALFSLESKSTHPLGSAIVSWVKEKYNATEVHISEFTNITGLGIQGKINGQDFFVGSNKLLETNNIKIQESDIKQAELTKPLTYVYFANNSEVLAVIGLADKLRETSVSAIKAFESKGIEVHLLSGDQPAPTTYFAKNAGISHFKGGMSPIDKINYIKELQSKGRIVAMAGDGINDAAALSQADLGIAMAAGSDIAMESSGVVLLRSDLIHILHMIRLSNKILKTIKQNFFWAFFYNIIAIPIAAGVLFPFTGILLNPMIAGGAMAVSSVSVVSNSLRLRKVKMII